LYWHSILQAFRKAALNPKTNSKASQTITILAMIAMVFQTFRRVEGRAESPAGIVLFSAINNFPAPVSFTQSQPVNPHLATQIPGEKVSVRFHEAVGL
jgi:hypothetical protein